MSVSERPGRSTWMDRFQLASHICTIIALVALLVQMKNDADNQRTQASLSYVQQFNDEPISTHWQNLETAWLPQLDKLALINETEGLTRPNIDRLVNAVLAAHDGKNGATPTRISIHQVSRFFDHLLVCRRKKLCNPDLIDEYFGISIQEFWKNYQTLIIGMRRSGTKTIGKEIESYVSGAH